MIVYIEEGDIFSFGTIKNYAHGCNCAGAMGKGIALTFKEKFPDMYAEYKKRCQMKLFLPGDVYEYQNGGVHVYNLATQVSWRSRAKLVYVKESLQKMMQLAKTNGVLNIALPAIGTGLGGLDWNDVKRTIEEAGAIFPEVNLFVVKKFESGSKNNIFVKKKWEEGNMVFYIHFEGEYAVRQIEINDNGIVLLSMNNPYYKDSSLYDQTLLDLELEEKDFISGDEFERVWSHDKGILFK